MSSLKPGLHNKDIYRLTKLGVQCWRKLQTSALLSGCALLCIWTLSSHTQEGKTQRVTMALGAPDFTSVHHHIQQERRGPPEARTDLPRNLHT